MIGELLVVGCVHGSLVRLPQYFLNYSARNSLLMGQQHWDIVYSKEKLVHYWSWSLTSFHVYFYVMNNLLIILGSQVYTLVKKLLFVNYYKNFKPIWYYEFGSHKLYHYSLRMKICKNKLTICFWLHPLTEL